VLQPRYLSLPFYSYTPFNRPDWDAFALLVRADAATSAPQSLLLQRALPELSSVLESMREALLYNGNQLAYRLEGIQSSLDCLLQGQVPVTFTGYFGMLQRSLPTPGDAAVALPTLTPVPAYDAAALSTAPLPGPPVYTALAKVYTVKDVWREWREGLAGQPALQELEEAWGSCWRPGNVVRVQFCRRKVVWDEVLARVARSKSEDAAVAELELLRASRSLSQLVDELKHRCQHQHQY
jgi:hypothetical protein